MTTVVGGKFYPDFKTISTILPLENSQNAGFIWFQMDEGYVKPHKVSLDDFNLQFLKPYTVNSFITLGNTGNVKVTSLSNGGFKLDFDYSGIINWKNTNDFKINTVTEQGITYNTGLPNWTIPNTYTDTKVSDLATKTTSDIATAKQQAIDTAKIYTDGQITTLGNKTTSDIATAKQQAITTAETYTDTKVSDLATKTTSDIATAKQQAIDAAKIYTDGQITTLGNKTTNDIATAKQQAITAAETYTDAQIPTTMRSLLMPSTQGNCVVTQNADKTFIINYSGGSGDNSWKDTNDFKIIPVVESGTTYNTGLPNWSIPNTYTDTEVTALATKTTSDIATAKQEAIDAAKTYTDAEITTAINNIEADIAESLSEAKTYTDTKVSDLATKTTSDIATAKQQAITTAETYTDTKVAALATKTTSDIATAKQEAIDTAKTYTDTQVTTAINNLEDDIRELSTEFGMYVDNKIDEVRNDVVQEFENRDNYLFINLSVANYELSRTNYNVYVKRTVSSPYFIILPNETTIGAVYTISVDVNSDYVPLSCLAGYTIENSVIVDPNEDTIINPQQVATCILASGNIWKVRISNNKITPIANSTSQANFPKLPQGGDLVHAKDVGTLWYFDRTLGSWEEIKQQSIQAPTITSWNLNNSAGQPLTMEFTGLGESANPAYRGLLPNNALNKASWKRVKDTLYIKGKLQIEGSGVTQTVPTEMTTQMYYRVKIDPIQGLQIDSAKMPVSSSDSFFIVGSGSYSNNKTGQIGTLSVFYTSVGFVGELFFVLNTQQIKGSFPQTNLAEAGSFFGVPVGDKTKGETLFLGEGDIEISYEIEYPVVGWD